MLAIEFIESLYLSAFVLHFVINVTGYFWIKLNIFKQYEQEHLKLCDKTNN